MPLIADNLSTKTTMEAKIAIRNLLCTFMYLQSIGPNRVNRQLCIESALKTSYFQISFHGRSVQRSNPSINSKLYVNTDNGNLQSIFKY